MITTTIYTDKLVPLKCSNVSRRKRIRQLRRLMKARRIFDAAICVVGYTIIYIAVTGMWGGVGT